MAPFLIFTSGNEMIKEMSWFLWKFKFDVNQNIEWHLHATWIDWIQKFNQIESKFLNWIKIHWIKFKLNWNEMKQNANWYGKY
jgi:hypothetical protein